MGIFDLFKKKKPRTALDEVNEVIVKGFRRLGEANGVAPTSKLSDEDIIEIAREVGFAFKQVAEKRNEHLKAGYLFAIQMKFFAVYETQDNDFYREHLDYECDKYLREGLREDYKQDIKLF